MVVEAVEAVVSVVILKLKKLLTDESKTYEKVRDDVEKAVMELTEMQHMLKDAEHLEPSNKVLTDWVMLFLNKLYRVGDAIECFALAETRLKNMGFVNKHRFVIANELKLCREVPYEMDYTENARKLKSRMDRISKEIKEWEKRKPSMAQERAQSSRATLERESSRQENYASQREKTIFKKDVGELLKQITSDNKTREIISVCGEVGIGKTAHVKKIYNKLKKRNIFTCHALVDVHANWSIRHLLIAVLQQVTDLQGKERLRDDQDPSGKLCSILQGQKYLIVINDITDVEILNKLEKALPDKENGSRVVITTSSDILSADTSSCYHFKPLDIDDGFKFFVSKTWGQKGCPFSLDNMEHLKNRIAESCKGTLLRIGMLSGLLSMRREIYQDWRSVFEQQDWKPEFPSFDILVFCYNDLPIHLRPCFLYLALFRKGFEIPVIRLFRLWLAEGFVEPSRGIIPEDIVEGYLEELLKRNLVEITKRRSDESPKKCRMIGVLHDIFLQRAVDIGLFHLHRKPYQYSNEAAEHHRSRIRRVIEYANIKDYSTSEAFNHNLQSYISFNGRKKDMPAKEVGPFLEKIIGARGFGLLKVLDLEGVYRPRLPENLGNFFHLRYLGLRWTFLDTLPSSIGSLVYLETLDIKHTHITTFPCSIWNMKHLHHLCLNGARLDISAQSTKHAGPSQLQTLQGLFVDEKIARKIGSTLSRMTNLRKLDLTRQSSSTTSNTTTITKTNTITTTISYSSSYEEIGLWISLLCSLQSLRLRSKDKTGRPSDLIVQPFSRLKNLSQLYLLGHLLQPLVWYKIPPGLKVLTLSISKLNEDPMPTLSQLPNLMVLRLLANSYVGDKMLFPENGFPALQVLKLWKLGNLTTLNVHVGTMQNLHTLEIRGCTKLHEVPETLMKIESFDKLILTNMTYTFVSATRNKKKKHTKIVENHTTSE